MANCLATAAGFSSTALGCYPPGIGQFGYAGRSPLVPERRTSPGLTHISL